MSDAEQFKAAVPERSGPKDWRGGLERMRRQARQGRAFLVERGGMRRDSTTAPALCAREKNKPESRWSLSSVALSG
jgi:hypothetical protein